MVGDVIAGGTAHRLHAVHNLPRHTLRLQLGSDIAGDGHAESGLAGNGMGGYIFAGDLLNRSQLHFFDIKLFQDQRLHSLQGASVPLRLNADIDFRQGLPDLDAGLATGRPTQTTHPHGQTVILDQLLID
jgi:hypothetical protein